MGSSEFGTSRSDIEKYLAEENEPDAANFGILDWWRKSSHRLPILSILARDVLAIPVSTVASESAFSTGGCLLSDFRSSLTLFTVQALICAQDWF
uniref:HAT C-terminal dimerisation domain-containing protein n=1 Tax=Arundo donax TaxID=35708 RepID=A0A0A8Z4H4_ARUDO